MVHDYLKKRKQISKVNDSYSSWSKLKFGVPQESILGPLLFNIFINDIFYFIKDTKLANYADDNTIYTVEDNTDDLLKTLGNETTLILNWFRVNEIKSNDDKSHLIVCNQDHVSVILGNETFELLGINIDKNLNFNGHITNLCKKAIQKLHALARISKYLNEDKLKILRKTFVQSQFNYCPLVWMFHNRTLNNKINKLHEKALRIVYGNDNSSFQKLLNRDNSITIHHRNLQRLEMYKINNHISPLPMQELFAEKINTYELRKMRCWESSNVRTVRYGTETIRYRGPKIWELVPKVIKESKSLREFKEYITKWKPEGCTCRLCKSYNLGFIN